MNRRLLDKVVIDSLASRRLLDHPFYVRWSRGDVTVDELREYAEQYRHFEAVLPDVLRTVAVAGGAARKAVEDNLADEAGGPVTHVELFDDFATALVARPDQPPSPAMANLLATYGRLASAGPIPGISAVLAYETQSADIAASKVAGLREHYGMDGRDVAFWDVHAGLDHDHAAWLVDGLIALDAEPAEVSTPLVEAGHAWWEFLDEREAAAPLHQGSAA
jgi:pyrroloquinoline-quinone synthase